MLVPLSWLGRYVDLNLSIEELSRRLSASGSSVERVYTIGQGLDDLVVAKVLEVKPHPNADRLRLAVVDAGTKTFEVVCGASNLAADQHVAFAPVGAHVPVNMHQPDRQSFTLESAEIRGVVSQGMICSAAEMGLGEDHDGIVVLPDDTEVGTSISQALGYPQTVFDIEITTNRPDQLSIIGLSREVGVVTGQPLHVPQAAKLTMHDGQAITTQIDASSCFRLMTQVMSIKVGPSPWWLQQLLSLAGVRPINNVVDVTNFVMLEYGQPLHAYDLRKLRGDRLIARMAKPNETIRTLDGVERPLTESMLVIADQGGPVGIAGIMGGEASKTDEATTEIVLEAAVFDPVTVRRTANALALRSEASKRFERGVDRDQTHLALQRAAELLVEVADGRVISPPVDLYPQPFETRHVFLSSSKLQQYLDTPFTLFEAKKILQSLGFDTVSHDDEVIEVTVPSWRMSDVEQEEDLIEEVVRIYGYDQLPVSLPTGPLPKQPLNRRYATMTAMTDRLTRAGWTEVVTTSLTNQDVQVRSGRPDQPVVNIANPLSRDWTSMRESLLPGLLQVAESNSRHHDHLRLFELSAVYILEANGLPQERTYLSLIMTAADDPEQSVGHLKGMIETLARRLGWGHLEYQPVKSLPGPLEATNAVAIVADGHSLGHLGGLQLDVQQAYGLGPMLAAELDVTDVLAHPVHHTFQPLPKFPAVEEDLSLIMADDQPLGTAIDAIRLAGGNLIEAVDFVETYRGKGVETGHKSPLLHLTFRASDRTLSSSDLSEVRTKIQQALSKHDIRVRSA